ncbi:MAG: ABC transporter permease [Bacteroidia bacterium]
MRGYLYNFEIAIEAIGQNKLRALLTSLGIIFGVASVIAMLGIGKGAKQEILEQMQALGANNVIIKPVIEQEEGEVGAEEEDVIEAKRFTPGLTMLDVQALSALPFVRKVSPEVELETTAIRDARKRSVKLVGVGQEYFETSSFSFAEGESFSEEQLSNRRPVCVIGQGVKSRFFATEEPIGKQIKCGNLWLTVVGVLKPRNVSASTRDKLGIRNFDLDVYAPISTVLLRFRNRSLVTLRDIEKAASEEGDDEVKDSNTRPPNYHQLDKVVVQVDDNRYSPTLAEIISRMLSRRHNGVVDFEIVVPETLLKQEQRTRDLLNLVLGAIASISLIVGGIGIMNIMLASVLERIREIGLRLSIGATPKDIILQFMGEAVAISVSGGVIGIALGVGLCLVIDRFAGIPTEISSWSVILSFAVAVLIGLVFGIYPAQQAAGKDPVESLRSN